MKDQKKKRDISKKTKFSELIRKFPKAMEILIEEGLYCVGCPMSPTETLEQGCRVHGINVEKVIKKLNKTLNKKQT